MKKRTPIQRSNVWKGYADVRHFFFNYPFKKVLWHKVGKDDKRPYIPVGQQTDTELSVNVNEYISIIDSYLDTIIDELLSGERYRFHSGIGELRLVKYKSTKCGNAYPKLLAQIRKEYNMTDQEAKDYIMCNPELVNKFSYYNNHLQGNKFNIAWFRHGWGIKFSSYWNMKLSKYLWRKAWNYYISNPSDIHKLQNSTTL